MKHGGILPLTVVLTLGVGVALSGGEGKSIEGTLVDNDGVAARLADGKLVG